MSRALIRWRNGYRGGSPVWIAVAKSQISKASVFFLALLFCAAGCDKKTPAPANIVAQVGDVPITADALQRLMDMRAAGNTNQFATTAAKTALLDELIRREAILAKAKAAGFDQ